MIECITEFITSGALPQQKKIPSASCKQPGKEYPLHPNTPMVYGVFKNDLATRIFLKKLIGNHFHYTVFGLDWIKMRWYEGNPPTYADLLSFGRVNT